MNRAVFVCFLAVSLLSVALIAPAIFAQPLTGTKTIGGTAPDYATFTVAANALRANGVGTGGVTFQVRPGTYAEHCSLTTVTGASQTNPIIFHATPGTVTLNNSSMPNTGARVCVELYGARWVTFDGIDVADSTSGIGTYFQVGYALMSGTSGLCAQHDTIKNCTITLNRQNDSSFAIYGLGYSTDDSVTCSYNSMLNLRITNCQHGIFLSGGPGIYSHNNEIGSTTPGFNFTQRTIIGSGGADDIGSHNAYGIYAGYQNNLIIHDIDVRNIYNNYENGDPYQSPIQTAVSMQKFSIYRCRIYNARNVTTATLSMNGMRLATTDTVRAYNNILYNYANTMGTAVPTGTYLRGILVDVNNTGTIFVDNNTVVTDHNGSDMTTSCISTNGSGQVNVHNNIMYNRTTGQTVASGANHRCLSGLPTGASDYNLFYLPDTVGAVFAYSTTGTNYTSLGAWQATGQDAHGIVGNPLFVNDTSNFHIQIGSNSPVEGAGTPVGWVADDIDGQVRDLVHPDIGADETPSRATLVLSHPNGGETLPPGTADTIRWTSQLVTGNIRIELNRSYPAGTWTSLSASAPNTGSFVWTPALPTTSQARIRIMSVDSAIAGDTCNTNFSIGTFYLGILYPNGGEMLLTNTNVVIRWSTISYPGTMRLKYNANYPTGPWTTIATGVLLNAAQYNWTIPTLVSNNVRIAAVPDSFPLLADTCDANFSIRPFILHITRPNGGDTLLSATQDTIRWDPIAYTGTATIRFQQISPFGIWTTIGTNIPMNNSFFPWTIPNVITDWARIAIVPDSFPTISDTSDNNFSIRPFTLTIIHPNGGDSLVSGTRDSIRWNPVAYTGTATIKLITVYPFGAWTTIASGVALNSGRRAWVIPYSVTDWARIAIIPDSLPQLADTSDNNFSIVRYSVQILHPNGGETLYAGTRDTILWIPNRATGNCILLYAPAFTPPVTNWITIASNIRLDTQQYVWTVPNTLTTQARLRIIPISNAQYADSSDANFTIAAGNIVISHPNGGDTLWGGSRDTIRWTPNLASGFATIKFNGSYPSGAWTIVAQNVNVSSSQYIWTIPNQATSTARVAIIPDTARLADTSNANFGIIFNSVPNFFGQIPQQFAIAQAYPNPFNNELHLTISIPTSGMLDVTVTDILGREVSHLYSGRADIGYVPLRLSANRLASGEYLVRAKFGQSVLIKKVMYLK